MDGAMPSMVLPHLALIPHVFSDHSFRVDLPMHLSDLKHLHVSQLVEMAIGNEIDGANRLRKQDLIFALLKTRPKGRKHLWRRHA